MGTFLSDLRLAIRQILKAPGFAAVAILSLAVGIGPNTAIYSLVDTILFQEWGVEDPEGLVDVYSLTDDGRHFQSYHYVYELVRDGAPDIFDDVTAYTMQTAVFQDEGRGEMVLGEMVTGNYFDVLGVQAARGRTFLPEEDATPGTHPVVVLSHRLWQNRFGGDAEVVGRPIRINGRPYTVLGVAPPEFKGRIVQAVGSDFWVPLQMYPHLSPEQMNNGNLLISGRLRPGVEMETAQAAVRTVATRYNEERLAQDPDRKFSLELAAVSVADVKLGPDMDGIVSAMAVLLLVAVGLVLLVACTNLAGFLLARATDRRKEMAVRTAMGAGRGTLVRQLLVESLVLACLGGILGVILGQFALNLFLGMDIPLPVPLNLEVGLNGRVLLFTGGVTLVAAVAFGLAPALGAVRSPVASVLRDESGGGGGGGRVRTRKVLVAAQMAFSTVLILAAGLFARSLHAAGRIDPGFDTGPAGIVTVEAWANEYSSEELNRFVGQVLPQVLSRPGVTRAAVTARLPLDLGNITGGITIPGKEPPPGRDRFRMEFTGVSPGYFDVMGMEVREGRSFLASDLEGNQAVAVITRAAAERYWPGESAVGRVFYRGGNPEGETLVVGVVEDAKIWTLTEEPRPYFYFPWSQSYSFGRLHILARGTQPPRELARAIREEALAMDPDLYLSEVGTMADHLGYIFFLPRMAALLLSLVGGLALALACVGLFGMVSYGVAQRTRELGIRATLGAQEGTLVGLVVRGGLVLVAVGGGIGLVVGAGLGVLAQGFLIGVRGLDPVSLLAAPLFLAGAAGLAAYLPARRVSRIDPVEALRAE